MTNHTDLLRRALDALYRCRSIYTSENAENWRLIEELRTAIETGGWLPIEGFKRTEQQYLFCDHNDVVVAEQWSEKHQDWTIPYVNSKFFRYYMPLPPPPNSPHPKDVRSGASNACDEERSDDRDDEPGE